ncbi:MAG: hemin ABC transporter substrate-binding protein [Thermomicrobiales bacterium]
MFSPITRRIGALLAALALVASMALAPFVSAQTPEASPASGRVPTPTLPVTVTDASGASVTITDVSRIITLNGDITETVFTLGLGGNVVADDVSALYPPEAVALPKIGYQRELNAEGILSFEPTVVIGDEEAGPPEVIQQIRDAGIPVVIVSSDPSSIYSPVDEIKQVGAALGIPEEGDALATSLETQLKDAEALAATATSKPRVAFLYIRGQGTQMIAGTGTAADLVITAAGGINAGADSGIQGYAPITPEALVATAPDIILVMQGGLASVGGVDGLLAIPGVAQTPAGESKSIVAFEDLYLLGFGPRLGAAVHDLTLALHPDLTGEPINPQWQGTDVEVMASPAASPSASPAS